MVKLLMTIETIHCFFSGICLESSIIKVSLADRSSQTAGGSIQMSCEVDSQGIPDCSGEFILSAVIYRK